MNVEKHIKDYSFKLNKSKVDMPNRIKELSRIKEKAPLLKLTVVNQNNVIKKGTVFMLNCQGIEGKPGRNDGYVYFGFYPHNMSIPTDESGFPVVDYNMKIDYSTGNPKKSENENEMNHIGRHFVIEFSLEKMRYIIKDLGIGYGTFVRLDCVHTLKDNQLINVGQIFIIVNINDKLGEGNNTNAENSHFSHSQNNANNNSIASAKANQLKLKIYGVNNDGDTFYFMPQNHNISIGRYELADIKLNDRNLSQIHCVINYSEKEGWKLKDGQVNKPSTNGTWIYISEEQEIKDKMFFKTSHTIFQAEYIYEP